MAGEFAQWLALPLYAGFITSPLSMIFAVVERQKLGLYMQSVLMLLRLAPLIFGIIVGGLQLGVACFSIGGFLGYMAYTFVAFKVVKAPITRLFFCLVVDWTSALICILPLVVAIRFSGNPFLLILAACISSVGLYLHLSRMTKSPK